MTEAIHTSVCMYEAGVSIYRACEWAATIFGIVTTAAQLGWGLTLFV